MSYYILALFFVFSNGTNGVEFAVIDTYEQCAYTEAILKNDYAYLEWNPLKAAICIPVTVGIN